MAKSKKKQSTHTKRRTKRTPKDTLPSTPPSATPAPNSWTGFGSAYDKRLAEIKAVPESEIISLNLDVHSAIATVLGTLPAIGALKDRFEKLEDVNQEQIAGLDEYAGAAAEASMRYETAIAPSDEIIALNDAAIKTRETLRVAATALAHGGLIDSNRLAGFKGLVGYKNVGFELLGWASVLHDA